MKALDKKQNSLPFKEIHVNITNFINKPWHLNGLLYFFKKLDYVYKVRIKDLLCNEEFCYKNLKA